MKNQRGNHVFKALYVAFRNTAPAGDHHGDSNQQETNKEAQQGKPEYDCESTPLLPSQQTTKSQRPKQDHQQPSLTGGFVDFAHSWSALRLCVLHAAAYYALAVLGFAVTERLSVIDALYFATVMFTTVGYGGITPHTVGGRCFTMLLGGYGIVILGIFVGIAGELFIERRQKTREEQTKRLTAIHTVLDEEESDTEFSEDSEQEEQAAATLQDEIFDLVRLELPGVSLLLLLAWMIGHAEGWSIFESTYWFAISGSTIGLGDYYPTLPATRLVCVVFLPLCVAVIGEILTRIAGLYMDRQNDQAEIDFLQQASLTLQDLERLDIDESGDVDKCEFLIYMLKAFQKVEQEDIDSILKLFDRLDVNKNGTLEKDDIAMMNRGLQRSIHLASSRRLLDSTSSSRRLVYPRSPHYRQISEDIDV